MNVLRANVVWISHGRDFDLPAITATKWRYRGASNPRDKVFGLLGLVPEGADMVFANRCGYDSTEAALFASFTLDSIVASDGLQPLHFNPRLEDDIAAEDVPRWALDFKGSSRHEADPFYRDWAFDHYRACGGRALNVSYLRRTVEANAGFTQALGVSGLRFGTVVEVSRERCAAGHNDVIFADAGPLLSGKLRAWHALAAGHSSRRHADLEDETHIASQLCNQVFFLTESGAMGMGLWDTRVGDEVWVLDGGNYPFALRPRGQEKDCEDFDFLACCHVEGIMFGEIFQTRDEADIRKIRLH